MAENENKGLPHSESINMSPTYQRLLGNKIVSAKTTTPKIKPLIPDHYIEEASAAFKMSKEETVKYLTETQPGGKWLETRRTFDSAFEIQAKAKTPTLGAYSKKDFSNFPTKPETTSPIPQPVPRETQGEDYGENVQKLFNASKKRTPELSEQGQKFVAELAKTREELQASIAAIEKSEREDAELNQYTRDANAKALRALLTAQKRGSLVTDEDLLRHDYSQLNKEFENPQLQRRQERIRSGENVAPESYLDVSTVERIREHNEAIQKDIDAQKELTAAKKKETETLQQQKKDDAFEKKWEKDNQAIEDRLRRIDQLSPREDAFGKVERVIDDLLGHHSTEQGQFNRMLVSQVGRTLIPHTWSRGTQVWDAMKWMRPKQQEETSSTTSDNSESLWSKLKNQSQAFVSGNTGGSFKGGGGSLPPRPPGSTSTSSAGGGGKRLGSITSSVSKASTIGLTRIAASAAGLTVGAALLVGGAAAGAELMGLSMAAKRASIDLEKYASVLPRTQIQQEITTTQLQIRRFMRGQERYGSGKNLDELLSERVQINAKWQNANERIGMTFSKILYENTNPISKGLTNFYDGFSILVSNWMKSSNDYYNGIINILKGDLAKGLDDLNRGINRKAFEENDAQPLLWMNELERIFYDEDGPDDMLWTGMQTPKKGRQLASNKSANTIANNRNQSKLGAGPAPF